MTPGVFPPGPWDDEPDLDVWREPTSNLLCAIVRHDECGILNGYVRIPKVCPLHGRASDVVGDLVECHGGITFAGDAFGGKLPPGWWVGFDTGHGFDLIPGLIMIRDQVRREHPELYEYERDGPEWFRDKYRTWAYVRAETEALARQLAALPKDAL
jgi:hypothetical protein